MVEAMGTCSVASGALVGSCPSASRLGACSVPSSGGTTTTVIFYSDAGDTAVHAQEECMQNAGTWTAGS
jgi:hypothetical protein